MSAYIRYQPVTLGGASGGGTVTSVGLADGSTSPIYAISGSPVTTSGTLTFTLSTQSANKVFAGPTTGSAAQPTFRSLVTADMPAGTGTVTSVSVVSANGLAGTVATATTTPAITLSTSINAPVLAGNGTAISAATLGNLTDVGTDGITIGSGTGAVIGSGTTISQHVADTSHNGYLSSSDWNTFNGKTSGGITSLTGDVTASGPGAAAATVAAIQGTTVSGTTGSTNVVFSGSPTINTPSLNSTQIHNVADPGSAQDAATKAYVDAAVAALQPLTSVYAASVANIAGTYLNGVSGVGATFTTTATTAFAVDGVSPPLLSRTLIKDQSGGNGFQNGVYQLTTQAVGGVSGAILTRTLDYDTAADMNSAGLIPVINGTTNALSSWQQTAIITTVGSDALVFSEFTANPSLYLLKANNLSDVAAKATSFNNLSPMTTGGDLIYGGSSGAGTRLANGNAGQVLTSAGTTLAPTWATPTTGTVTSVAMTVPSFLSIAGSPVTSSGTLAVTLSGTALPIANGGTGQTTANNALNALLPSQTSNTGKVLQTDGTNTSWQSTSTGTVTSVGITGPSIITWSNTPVTTSGTLTGVLANQNAVLSLMGPAFGASAAAPTFRQIVPNDLLSTSQAKTGTYTILATDDYVTGDSSGGTFTFTLPAANAIPKGKQLIIKKIDSSLTKITITRAGSDTIDGATGTTLNTQYECLILLSDGSSVWSVVNRTYPQTWTSYTPTFGAGFGTCTSTNFYWKRGGQNMQIIGLTTTGTSAASLASFTIPSGPTVDTTVINSSGAALGISTATQGTTGGIPTMMIVFMNSGNTNTVFFSNMASGGSFQNLGAVNGNTFQTSSQLLSVNLIVPISGWN